MSTVFLGHSTVLLDLDGTRILTDPVLRGRLTFLRRISAVPAGGDYAQVDAVLLSHLHHDHCDLASLALLDPQVRIIAPDGAREFLRARGFRWVTTLKPGQSYDLGTVTVTATRAVHDGRRSPFFGPRAIAVGYLIITSDTRVYFAGDTDLFDGMTALAPDLDLALVPVWGWGPNLGPGHLDPHRAAEAVARLRPRWAVPVHWGTLFPYGMSKLFPGRLLHPPQAFARAVAARGLPTQVKVLEPGGEFLWQP
jgi:L-ascorbate metabolism protein UlaG (beta-lactamase superfamily)